MCLNSFSVSADDRTARRLFGTVGTRASANTPDEEFVDFENHDIAKQTQIQENER